MPRRLPLLGGAAAFLACSALESLRPLRPRVEPRGTRLRRNLTIFATTAAVLALIQKPILRAVSAHVERHRLGLLNRLRLHDPLRTIAGVLLLDYTLWWWHRANHQLPILWRSHRIHHLDRDLDASTALRFHYVEMALSVLLRAGQIRLLGTEPAIVERWNSVLIPCILFQHSNTRLPERLDRGLARLLVTPRMHGIHHADVAELTDSNWSSLFTLWDVLHGTLRLDVPQEHITIGVPEGR
jgi:sterol desaturase/sphingolipid hydroxylase (fatty acid hydroxylase superfamily)